MPIKDRLERRLYAQRWAYASRTTPGQREKHLIQRYGITEARYQALLEKQDSLCAICRQPPRGGNNKNRLVIDHDHETGEVRGLLCDYCNRTLGFLENNFEATLAYLHRWTDKETVKQRMDKLKEIPLVPD